MNLYSRQKGFSLAEVIVGSAVFAIVSIAVYGAYGGLFRIAHVDQARMVATQLANEQFEIIRNMPYANIGTIGGVPSGTLYATTSATRSGITFEVDTLVRNVDLPFDGTALLGTDTNPVDNKLVQLTISCATCQSFAPVVITGQIAPKSGEAATTDTGALNIQVIDAQGHGVPNASVNVINSTASPVINLTDTTDNDGYLEIYGVATGTNAYKITATKTGYSTDQTYPVGGGSNPNPLKPNSTVATEQVTSVSFSIDTRASLAVASVATSCDPVANFNFSLTSNKTNDVAGLIPKYFNTFQTNSSGVLTISPLEWDSYDATSSDLSYDIAGVDVANPISVSPGASQTAKFVLMPKNGNSLLVTVKDSVTKTLASHSTVELVGPSGYDQTLITDQDAHGGATPACMPVGQVLFQGLQTGSYTISVSNSGYSTTTSIAVTVGSGWQEEQVLLSH